MKIDASLMFDPVVIGDMAQQLEAAGFDGAYTFDGQNDAFLSLASAAMKTARMDLMTSIAVAFARNPMTIAYMANDLQLLSQGRFILGLGTQVKAHIERRFSMPWSRPAARMREMVQAIRAIWQSWASGERLRFEGEFYRHTLMPPTFTPKPHGFGVPKIFIAGVGPLMTRVAAEVGDGYFVHPFHSAHSLQSLSMPAIEQGLKHGGKSRQDLTLSAQVITATGNDAKSLESAIVSARNQIAFYASTPAYAPVLQQHGWEAMQPELTRLSKDGRWQEMAALVDDDVLHTFAVVGSPAEVGRKLVARCHGVVDRLSPVLYQPDTALLIAVRNAIADALPDGSARSAKGELI